MTPIRTAYFVTIVTNDSFPVELYQHNAGLIVNTLQDVLGDPDSLETVIHTPESQYHTAHIEVEVKQVELEPVSQIVCRTVVEIEAEQKVKFDKNAFTKIVRARLPFSVKVQKQEIPRTLDADEWQD